MAIFHYSKFAIVGCELSYLMHIIYNVIPYFRPDLRIVLPFYSIICKNIKIGLSISGKYAL